MISVGIIGGSGYTGKELLKILSRHPFISSVKVYGHSTAGEKLSGIFPELTGLIEDDIIASVNNISMEHDLFFIALPHGEALKYVPSLMMNRKKIVDLGGDYRLDSADEFVKWYKLEHTSSFLLESKLYGLADVSSADYSKVSLIANPGCYPTATLLSLIPLARGFGKDILSASVAAYSGTSGAGKSPKADLLMSEMFGNSRAYNVNNHRHEPEIFQELKKNGFDSPFSFTTHLLPVSTGIYATSSVHMKSEIEADILLKAYKDTYKESRFVRLRETPPNLSWVVGTNFCDINVNPKGKTIIITAAVDNLVKGAAGQAIQNMNKLYNWEESTGIINTGVKNASVY